MFQINSILNPSALNDVLEGLQEEGIHGVTVTNVLGRGCWDGSEVELIEKTMVIVVVPDSAKKERAMEAIRANAQDIDHGSGKMWVTPVLEVERIRTGEKDTEALGRPVMKNTNAVYNVDVDTYTTIDTPAS